MEVAPPVELHPCHHCNRTFAKGRLEIHERVCQRIFGEKRHTYDALNKRTHDTPFRPTQAHKCNQCGRAFAHQEEMLVHERACGGNRSASRSRNKGRPMSSGGRGGNNELDNGWGPHTSVSSSNGSAIKSARRNRGSRTPSFGNQLRDGGSSIMLDTLDENELAQPMVGMRFAEDETEEEEGDISLAGPPSVVRVEGSGSLNSLNMKTPSGRSSRIPRSANRSGNRSVTRVSFFDGVAYLAMFSKLILFTLDYLFFQTFFFKQGSAPRSSHKSNARSSCPFCKHEVHSSDLSSHLLRCRRQQASRDNVWRNAKRREEEQKGNVAPSSVGRTRHPLSSTPSNVRK